MVKVFQKKKILNQLQIDLFLQFAGYTFKSLIDDLDLMEPKSEIENEADELARKSLIPSQLWKSHPARKTGKLKDIIDLAGKYGVDKDGFEEFLATLDLLNPDVELMVIDKIGKMELFSNRFRNLVCDALNAYKQVLAIIPLKGDDFIDEIKQRLDIHLLEVTHANRDRLSEAIVESL